ncbi:MAG: DUF4838 domain-containing protein [Clostridia bacterium]|nr:DUF4838 domain-containing protein [Clostridia bacterium]
MSFQLAKDGKALALIVTAKGASEQEAYAATELRNYLTMISGAAFDAVQQAAEGKNICVGAAARELLGPDDGLGEDGFRLKVTDECVAIDGGKRGVIYGVYEFLEALGCRFFTPECEKVPVISCLAAEPADVRRVPVFEYRDHNYHYFRTCPRFAVKTRLNGNSANIPERFGGHNAYTWFVHTFENLVPTTVYGQEHPEYFAMYDGKRRTLDRGRTQLCLTNPEVLFIATESARRALKEHPGTRIISISQNDVTPGCQCANCLAADREEGSPAGTLLRFVNAIAEALEPEFPDVIFDTLAYNHTRPVPKITRPRHNVCVRLCSIECCFSHPFETCDDDRGVTLPDGTKSSFIRDLKQWGAYHDRLYIWDYTTCFAHYAAPFPNWRTLAPNMRSFANNHVKGVFEQANGSVRGGADFNEMRAYLIGKLLWDPWCDAEKHIREFSDFYYGAAGKYVREYIDALCGRAEKDDIHVGFNDQTETPLYDEKMLAQLDEIMDRAEEAVQGDVIRLFRVKKARMCVRWVRLKNKNMRGEEMDPQEVSAFFTDWRAYGLGRLDEWVNIETTHRALVKRVWRGVQFYDHWVAEGPELY